MRLGVFTLTSLGLACMVFYAAGPSLDLPKVISTPGSLASYVTPTYYWPNILSGVLRKV
jgi:hypothetical protein